MYNRRHLRTLRQAGGAIQPLRFACLAALCALASHGQGIRGVTGWTGTVKSVANQSGSGSTNQFGMTILEDFSHDSTASLRVTLAKDPTHPRRWTGTAQGTVSINNRNLMTMVPPPPATFIICTGTLTWFGFQPSYSGQATIESDDSGLNYRLWITPNTIPAPDSGSVVCPSSGLRFPTVDPNSAFIPKLEAETRLFPVSDPVRLIGGLPYLGDSGIGGFVASPFRVTYNVSWDLTATGVQQPDPPPDPDCRSAGSIIGCLDQTLGETIPVAGTPYRLRYRSDRAPGYRGGPGPASPLGLGGWWLDAVHIYLPGKRTLLAGDGTSTLLAQSPAPGASGLLSVSDPSGDLTFVFNSAGRHLRTDDTRSGITVLTLDYDAQGRLAKLTDAAGNAATIERDPAGNPTAIRAPYGQRTLLRTTSAGLLSQVQNPAAEIHALQQDGTGLLTGLTNPAGANWLFSYSPTGRLLTDTGPLGATTTLARQDAGQNFTVTLQKPGGLSTRFESTAITGGRRTTTTHPSGAARTQDATLPASTLTYENGVKVSVTHARSQLPPGAENSPLAVSVRTPAGLAWSAQWSRQAATASAPRIDTLKVNGAAVTEAYDASRRTIERTSAAGRKSTLKFNEKGAPVELGLPSGPVYFTEYDQRGKPVAIRRKAGEVVLSTSVEWNAAGLASAVTTPSGSRFEYAYDEAGRLLSETLPGGAILAYTYDKSGNVASLAPPGRPAHTFTYDDAGRPLSYTVPSGAGSRVATYEYDAAGRLSKSSHPDSGSIVYSYDAGGRLAEASSDAGKLAYSYDQRSGVLARLAGPAEAVLNYTWDGGLLLSEQSSGAVDARLDWRYDHNFLPIARKVNGGEEVALVYDADGLLTAAGAYTLSRDAASGRPAAFVLGGTHGWWAHDAAGDYNASAVSALDTEIYSARYERDATGRIVRKEEYFNGSPITWEYEYDLRGRLSAARRDGELYAAYAWDDNDNRTAEQLAGGGTTAEYDSGDRLLTGNSTAILTGDTWGNLRSVELPGSRIDYVVDGLGRRIGRKVDGVLLQAWAYNDSLRPAAEFDAQGQVVSEFLYAGAAGPPVAMKRGGKHLLLIADQIGSIRMVVDSESGEIVQRLDYDPFGRVLHDSNPGFQPFGFAGGLYDPATGLVRMGAREYDPSLGRFTSEDPRPFSGGSNHYTYCGGDPVNLWDPLGTDPTSRASQVVQTADSKAIGEATSTVTKTIDTAGKAVEFARDPAAVLEAEATRAATPEGARSEYERTLEENARRAEENSTSLRRRLEELYERARRALCGGDEATPQQESDPNRQAPRSTPRPARVKPMPPGYVPPIYGPAAGARR